MPEVIKDIKLMMDGWNKIVEKVRVDFPKKSKEEQYQIAKSAMSFVLGIK